MCLYLLLFVLLGLFTWFAWFVIGVDYLLLGVFWGCYSLRLLHVCMFTADTLGFGFGLDCLLVIWCCFWVGLAID